MRKILLATLAAMLFVGPAVGQGLLKLRKPFEIPKTILDADADHATVAISDRGDILVAWQVDVPILSGTYAVKQVEAAFFERNGQRGWIKPEASDVMVLGNPGLGLLGAEAETCRKPDVVAVGETFVVTWPRNVPTGAPGEGQGQLECVRVRRDAVLGGAILDAPQAGAGYVVDPFFDSGDGGPMQDNVELAGAPDRAGVFYIHQEFIGFTTREFDMRFAAIDFSSVPPVITGPSVPIENLPLDDSPIHGPPGGGLVLPDVVLDDHGHLVLAYEEYAEAGHQGAPQTQGFIKVVRYSESGGAVTELDSWEFTDPAQPATRMRRPNVATSHHDGANTIQLCWMYLEDDPLAEAVTMHYELDFTGGVGSGLVLESDQSFPHEDSVADTLPVPACGAGLPLALATRAGFPDRIVAWVPGVRPNVIGVGAAQTTAPDRAHTDVWDLPPFGSSGSRVISITYEGPPTNGNGFRAIFIIVHRA